MIPVTPQTATKKVRNCVIDAFNNCINENLQTFNSKKCARFYEEELQCKVSETEIKEVAKLYESFGWHFSYIGNSPFDDEIIEPYFILEEK